MDAVIGGHTAPHDFAAFLADWEATLARRVDEAVAACRTTPGLQGLILAGGLGRGAPWPLSDIDLIPIYADGDADAAAAAIAARRPPLLERWIAEGWWSGLDVGRLRFTSSEVEQALQAGSAGLLPRLADDRWYHSLDKAYGGHAVLDANGRTASLVAWLTAQRFAPEVVAFRLQREHRELLAAQHAFVAAAASGDFLGATTHLRTAVKWLMTWYLEHWGERDNSQGRLGTRFAVAAHSCGQPSLVTTLHDLSDLAETQVWHRLAVAPAWVHERHDRSWRARVHVGEPITRLDDARDTLRVCALYGARLAVTTPAPAWLAVLDAEAARDRAVTLQHVIASLPHHTGARPLAPDCAR